MFGIGSFYFKMKAKAALKGNWQTALLVTFFAGIFSTALQVFQIRYFQLDPQELSAVLMLGNYEQVLQLMGITREKIYGFFALAALALLVSPALNMGRNNYFLHRIRGEELGFAGLISRFSVFFKALWLNILIAVKCLLWSLAVMLPVTLLILFVPGVAEFLLKYPAATTIVSVLSSIPPLLAALRYSMATYIMADKPETGAFAAIRQSKKIMANQKMNYVSLNISFVGWLLLSSIVYMMVGSINMVIGLVAQLFMETWIGAYLNGSVAAFYEVISEEDGLLKASEDLRRMMKNAGVEMPDFSHFGQPEDSFGQETEPESEEETDVEDAENIPDETGKTSDDELN